VTASSSLAGGLGYQSGWTDPVNGRVGMGARWYDPPAGGFTTRDSVAAGNPFGYGGDDPLGMTDPSGHMATAATGGGCLTAACAAKLTREPPAGPELDLVSAAIPAPAGPPLAATTPTATT